MPRLVGKADEFVLDTWAIPWPDAFYVAAVHGRQVQVAADDVGGLGRRVGHPAGNLFTTWLPTQTGFPGMFHVEQFLLIAGIVEREKRRRRIAFLFLHRREIDAAT